jgi:superfamily I DNA/RNA helicase
LNPPATSARRVFLRRNHEEPISRLLEKIHFSQFMTFTFEPSSVKISKARKAMTVATAEAPAVLQFMQNATDEQVHTIETAIDLGVSDAMRVRSGAGTGKTTTLRGIARAMGAKRGAYLAYNSSVAVDAAPKFADTNCQVKTFHAICLRVVGKMLPQGPLSRYDVNTHVLDPGLVSRFATQKISGWSPFKIALTLLHTFDAFCHSHDHKVTASHARHAIIQQTGDPEILSNRGSKLQAERALNMLTPILVSATQAFWEMRQKDMLLSFDAYVKLVHLRPDLRGEIFDQFDYVMIDEAQDMNPVQVAILKETGTRLIAVGDSAQSIHGWRGAVDALERLPGVETQLSRSFRFGSEIANMANHILGSNSGGCHGVKITGAGGNQPLSSNHPQYAILARSNMGLLDEAIDLRKRGFAYNFDRGQDILDQIHSAEALKAGDMFRVRSQEIRPFRSWNEMVQESETNSTLERIVSIIEERRVGEVEAVVKQSSSMSQAKVALMTAHRSKGLEFGTVKLAQDWTSLPDMAARLERAERTSTHRLIQARQEYNVLYVACTRAIRKVVGADALM